MSTPGGTRTRSLGVESPASRPSSTTGRANSGGRARTCDLAINSRASYPLDHAGTTKRMQQESKLRTAAGAVWPVAIRGLTSPAMPPRSGRRGSRTPKGLRAHPFSRRDTAPVAVLPRGGPGRRRTCTVPGKNRELCRLELRSLEDVTGRDRTCDAPRFRRALYRAELRPREIGGAGVEPAASSDQSGAPPPGLSSGRRGLGSN